MLRRLEEAAGPEGPEAAAGAAAAAAAAGTDRLMVSGLLQRGQVACAVERGSKSVWAGGRWDESGRDDWVNTAANCAQQLPKAPTVTLVVKPNQRMQVRRHRRVVGRPRVGTPNRWQDAVMCGIHAMHQHQ
jgi:hypothetical protein